MKKRILKRIVLVLLCLGLAGGIAVIGINSYVKKSAADQIITPEEAAELADVDCILALGCYVYDSGRPSDMLADRLRRGIELYQTGAAPKLLMSGDHGQKDYNEVKAMKLKAMEAGIPSEDVFMDHAGFSTYESIYRARDVFAADKVIIVTQEYHLYRALYIANALGVEAYGVAADYHTCVGQANREVREILARNKDFATSILKPNPTYLGEVIPVSGDGNLTNDEEMEEAVKTFEPVPIPEDDVQSNHPEPSELPEDALEEEKKDAPVATPAPEPEKETFVQVESWLPDVRTELRYATENNFTGQIIYTFDDAWLRYGTVQKLSKAQELLAEQGYSLLIWDAFRTTAAQWKLWEVFPDPVYVANPEKGYSSHSRGNTVDVTLVTSDGEFVEMPTEFDDFSSLADRDYSDVPEEAKQNAILLETVMTDCGFKPYSGEWWHFSDMDAYPVEELFIPD